MPDWDKIEQLFNSTLASIFNQTDPHFRVVVACTERPRLSKVYDDRLVFVHAPASPIRSWADAIADAGNRRRLAAEAIARAGGGYVMFVDADDLVSNRIVAHVRTTRNPNGYVAERGFGLNKETGSLAVVPYWEGGGDFSQICGTSFILLLSPDDVLTGSPSRYSRLLRSWHVGIRAELDAEHRPPEVLPFPAVCYVVATGVMSASDRAGTENARTAMEKRQFVEGIEKHRMEVTPQIIAEFALNEKPVLPIEPQQVTSLTVAISTFKRPQGLHRLLAALEPQIVGRPERKVVVINDGSHSPAYEAVAVEFAHMIEYHALPNNVGIAAARNESVKCADSEYVVFTDDDCLPPPHWLDWLAARLIASPDLDVIAGDVRPLMPLRPSFFAGVQARHGIYPSPARARGELRFVTANLAMRRSLFWKLGGFQSGKNFPGAGEDTDLSARMSASTCSRMLDIDWFVSHDVGDGIVANIKRFHRYGYANMLLQNTTSVLVQDDYLRWHTARQRIKNLRSEFRRNLPAAQDAYSWRAPQWLSAFMASLVFAAYYDGVAKAHSQMERKSRNF